MTDTPHPGEPVNGSSAASDAGAMPEAGVASDAGATPEASTAPAPPADVDHASRGAKVREAISLIKEHPLGAVATVAAATAMLELEFAVGVLAGLGATALLANKSGPERRKIVLERGKWALERAREMKERALKKRAAAARPAPTVSPV